ncbi:hypothetical protein EJB05_26393, partial [Eragrostis curvula]
MHCGRRRMWIRDGKLLRGSRSEPLRQAGHGNRRPAPSPPLARSADKCFNSHDKWKSSSGDVIMKMLKSPPHSRSGDNIFALQHEDLEKLQIEEVLLMTTSHDDHSRNVSHIEDMSIGDGDQVKDQSTIQGYYETDGEDQVAIDILMKTSPLPSPSMCLTRRCDMWVIDKKKVVMEGSSGDDGEMLLLRRTY